MPPTTRRRQPRPSTRRTKAIEEEEIDFRPVGEDGSRPPRLDLKILKRLKILLLANLVPLVGLGVIFYLVFIGKLMIQGIAEDRLWGTVLVVLIAVVVCGSASWVLLPFSRWCCDCPKWYYVHQSRGLWFLPLVAGYLMRILLWIVSIALIGYSLYKIGDGVWFLIATGFGGAAEAGEPAAALVGTLGRFPA